MNFSSQSFIALLRRRASLNVMVPKKQLLWKRRQENSSPPSSSSFFFEIFCPKFRQTRIRFSLSFFFSIIADSIQLKQQIWKCSFRSLLLGRTVIRVYKSITKISNEIHKRNPNSDVGISRRSV